MWRRWGLRAKMAGSYVLVTAAVVVLVEVVAAAVVLPRLLSGADRATLVQLLARDYANRVMQQSATLGRLPTASQLRLDQAAPPLPPGQARNSPDETGVAIVLPQRADAEVPRPPLVLLLAPTGGWWPAPSRPATRSAGGWATPPWAHCPPRSPPNRPPHGANATA